MTAGRQDGHSAQGLFWSRSGVRDDDLSILGIESRALAQWIGQISLSSDFDARPIRVAKGPNRIAWNQSKSSLRAPLIHGDLDETQ